MEKIKFILVGAGGRGTTYVRAGKNSCPEMELVAVADPNPVRINLIKSMFDMNSGTKAKSLSCKIPSAWN
jgi:predicted dehydrogenase